MSETFDLFAPTTSEATGSATSSPASGSGVTPSGSLAGPTMRQSGPEAAPASRSAPLGAQAVSMMNAISGRTGRGSSLSAELTLSLENRLRARTDSLGSTLFVLTWKTRATPSGRLISALRASAPPTSDSDFSSWGTPTAQDAKHAGISPSEAKRDHRNLRIQVHTVMAGWQTPTCPVKTNGHQAGNNRYVTSVVKALAHWHTPVVRDHRNSGGDGSNPRDLPRQASGVMPIGSHAPTEKLGPLNPEHSRWLMGLPAAWGNFAPTATRSSGRSQRTSSVRT